MGGVSTVLCVCWLVQALEQGCELWDQSVGTRISVTKV